MNRLSDFRAVIPHSCYPNCALNSSNVLVLLREVAPGEQLTIDYATLYSGAVQILECGCGHVGCRGKVLGFNFLPVFYQDYYLQKDAVCREVLIELHLLPENCNFLQHK
jgi:hypothetical protein